MTAVAEGAALFAESIEWGSESRARKSSRGSLVSTDTLGLTFNYIARTPDTRAKIVVQVGGEITSGIEFQVDSLDTGWTSGRIPLKDGAVVEVSLLKRGENVSKYFWLTRRVARWLLRTTKLSSRGLWQPSTQFQRLIRSDLKFSKNWGDPRQLSGSFALEISCQRKAHRYSKQVNH